MKKMLLSVVLLVSMFVALNITLADATNKEDYEKSALVRVTKAYLLTEPAFEPEKSMEAKKVFLKLLSRSQPEEVELLKQFLVDYADILMRDITNRTTEVMSFVLSLMSGQPGMKLSLKEEIEIQAASYVVDLSKKQMRRLLEIRSLIGELKSKK